MLCVVKRMVLPPLVVFPDDFPEQQSSLRVQAGAGLVQEKYLGVMHHSAGDGETLHHPARKSANHLIGTVAEFEAIEQRLRSLGSLSGIEAEIGTMEKQNFASRERKVKVRTLLNHSNPSLDYDLFRPHIVLSDPRLAARRSHPGGEDSSVVDLPAPLVRADQDLSGCDLEREAVEGDDFRLGLFVSFASGWPKPKPPPEARGGGEV